MRSIIIFAGLPPLLAGCATQPEAYPSLLPRAIEGRSDAIVPRPTPTVTIDPELDARLADLSRQAQAADRGFTDAATRAERLARAAAGRPEGSEAWLNAQVALAELDVARTAIDAPLAELERLAIDRGVAGLSPYPALDALSVQMSSRAAEQRRRITAIASAL